MKVGTAWADITPSVPIDIVGQMVVRKGKYTHDPITVNAVVFEKDDTKVALVSCDLCYMGINVIDDVQTLCEKELGIPAASVIIACTHTHLAPATRDTLYGDVNENFIKTYKESVVDIVRRALKNAEDVDIYAGAGWIDQMGFNRRGITKAGHAEMYYGSWEADFDRVEGPRDGQVGVLFARRPDGSIKAVVTSFSTHPNSMEGESFYSADLVGATRNFLRQNLGEDVGVVYLTGAAGDTAPSKLDDNKNGEMPWRGEEGWKRSGLYLGSEILKTIAGTIKPMPDPLLRLEQESVPIAIRPWPNLTWMSNDTLSDAFQDFYSLEKERWPEVIRKESPMKVRINVLRIGDASICTNPGELFVDYGLQIKKSSPSNITLISELTDGNVGYVPTEEAFRHGGYETMPAESSLLDEPAGGIIVQTTLNLLNKAFTA